LGDSPALQPLPGSGTVTIELLAHLHAWAAWQEFMIIVRKRCKDIKLSQALW
jgi:hypothetical protein